MAIALDTLEYARRLRDAGFTEEQADGQAHALAAAMTNSLATKEDLKALEVRTGARFDSMEARIDGRFEAIETRISGLDATMDARFDAHSARIDSRLADLERRVTVRMLAGIAAVSALVKLL